MNILTKDILWKQFGASIDMLENAMIFCRCKPSLKSWSLGQLYIHLINDTNFYIGQIKICISTNENISKEECAAAKVLFLNNGFPDEVIEGAPSNSLIPQPDDRAQLKAGIIKFKDDINNVAALHSKSRYNGKSKHPGLGFFTADQWLQFAEMHLRHHLKQKKRIDTFLNEKQLTSTNISVNGIFV